MAVALAQEFVRALPILAHLSLGNVMTWETTLFRVGSYRDTVGATRAWTLRPVLPTGYVPLGLCQLAFRPCLMVNTIATAEVSARSNAWWDWQYVQYVYQSGLVLTDFVPTGFVPLALYRLDLSPSRCANWLCATGIVPFMVNIIATAGAGARSDAWCDWQYASWQNGG